MTQSRHERPANFGAFRESLFQHFESLSPHLKRIARYALGEPNRFALQTVAQVASETRVQPSTLVRFAQIFGFSGYSDMQHLFRARLLESDNALRDREIETRRGMEGADRRNPPAVLDAVADASVLAIDRLKAHVDAGALREAVRLMDAATCIHVLGRGRALPVAGCLAHGLIELHRRCVVLDALAGTLPQRTAAMGPGDLLIAVAFETDAQPAIDAMDSARQRNVPIIAITDALLGRLSRHAGVNIEVRDKNFNGVSPLAPHIVLVQSLLIALGRGRKGDKAAGAEIP